MFLNDFETNQTKFVKIQKYLEENYGYELDMSAMDADKVSGIIKSTTEKMKVTEDAKEYTRLHMIAEGLKLWTPAPVQSPLTDMLVAESVDEEGVEQAKVILAAQEMNDELQKMVERVAEMQVQDLIPLVDAMKAELSMEQAEAFNNAVEGALGSLLDSVKNAKEGVENAILAAQGQAPATDMEMGGEMDMEVDMDGMDADAPEEDDFSGDDAAADADGEPEGRELKAEGVEAFDTMLEELQAKVNENGEVSRGDLEGALAQFRAK